MPRRRRSPLEQEQLPTRLGQGPSWTTALTVSTPAPVVPLNRRHSVRTALGRGEATMGGTVVRPRQGLRHPHELAADARSGAKTVSGDEAERDSRQDETDIGRTGRGREQPRLAAGPDVWGKRAHWGCIDNVLNDGPVIGADLQDMFSL